MSWADAAAGRQALDWRAWLELARVSNAPTAASNAVAGAVVASPSAAAAEIAPLALAIVLFYTAGMILNDVRDLEVDRRERPERPLPSGRVSPQAATATVAALFVAGEGLVVAVDARAGLAGVGLIGVIVAYDAWHKGNPLSPLLMGACRAMVYVVAGLAVAGSLGGRAWLAAALLGLYVAGLTQMAKTGPPWLARRLGYLIAGIALYDALVAAVSGAHGAAIAACLTAFLLALALQTRIAGT